jgi:hypothetical protein
MYRISNSTEKQDRLAVASKWEGWEMTTNWCFFEGEKCSKIKL